MNYKIIIIWILVIVGVFGFMWWSGKRQASYVPPLDQVKTESVLTSDKKLYEFGKISMANGLVSTVFKVTNPTNQDVNVERITTSCMCTTVYVLDSEQKRGASFSMPGHGIVPKANQIIRAGEVKEIEVVYDPAAHGPAGVGPIQRFIYLQDKSGLLKMEIKAMVTP